MEARAIGQEIQYPNPKMKGSFLDAKRGRRWNS